MSNPEFQERLARIGQQRSDQEAGRRGATSKTGQARRGPRTAQIAIGAILIVLGGQAIGFVNDHYEAIRDGTAGATVLVLALGALSLPFLGAVCLIHGFVRRK